MLPTSIPSMPFSLSDHVLFAVRYFRNEESSENVIVKKVGNVTADSEFTYEYGVRRKASQEEVSDPETVKSKSEKTST